ncbi:MAG TPA: hypothetical protein VL053_05560 [Arachidicoccus sp.]|nr:hypothetical protein [Arachidicoccus sp.]
MMRLHNNILKVIVGWLSFVVLLLTGIQVKGQSDKRGTIPKNPSDISLKNSAGYYVLDMVHNNPGEPLTKTAFADPGYLKKMGYNGQVVNDFVFAHAALTFDGFDKRIFPKGTKERAWVLKAAAHVQANIEAAHKAGLKVYYFTDLIVLPKRLVELYKDQICDEKGRISFDRPLTVKIHQIMLDELFTRFKNLDGLVIRTGETYLNNVPYHTGNNPITHGVDSHIKLLRFLRSEVCVKWHKMLFYRTWASGGMDQDTSVYLRVTNAIKPHPKLVFMIKHTKGDYHRTFDFNPTLGIGRHPQVVEVECQREYEGKGAFPNYIAKGVIDGFEEFGTNTPQKGLTGLGGLKSKKQFRGVWTWSRGGGWVGPYITNEFWPRLNAFVVSQWAQHPDQSESQIFDRFMDQAGITGKGRTAFRRLCLLSAKAVLRGHNSAILKWHKNWVWWTRDEFLSGTDGNVGSIFKSLYADHLLDTAIREKLEAVSLWSEMVNLSGNVHLHRKADESYIRVSTRYGLLLHKIIAYGWQAMALGYEGDRTGRYNKAALSEAIRQYDQAWVDYRQLKKTAPACATLYKPYQFVYKAPDYHGQKGMAASIDKYRKLIKFK